MTARRSRGGCRAVRADSALATWPFTPTKIAIALCALGFLSPSVIAGPTGGKVVAGSAEIRAQGNRTDIVQHSDRAVIDWRSFSISPNEAVYFQQQSNRSVALNRVTGDQVSSIQGILGARGQVILLNPNGILFGAGARVDVGSLIASTAWLSSDDFMNGRLNFTAPARAADGTCPWSRCEGGSVVNQGTVTAAEGGLVAFVAPHVRNDGLIWARLGRVMIGSGSSFTIDLNGDGLVNLAIRESDLNALRDAQGNPVGARIEHTGSTIADGGKIVMLAANDAKQLVNDVINLGGLVRANTVGIDSRGSIVLSATNGRLNLNGELLAMGTEAGQVGGAISALASNVKLGEQALVSASGTAGGGTIALRGAGGQPANEIVVAPQAALNVSAGARGNGGRIDLQGDVIEFSGAAHARGGAAGGNGGQVELVAGKLSLRDGGADAHAPAGLSGTFAARQSTGDLLIDANAATSISRTLRTGTNVAIKVDGQATVRSRIDGRTGTPGGSLTIDAGDVQVSNDIYTQNGVITLIGQSGEVRMAKPESGVPAPGRDVPMLHAESADIFITAAKDAVAHHLITTGDVSVTSRGGNVELVARLGRDDAGQYPLRSLTVRALGVPADDASVGRVGNVSLRDVMVAPNGKIDIHATRNIRYLEFQEARLPGGRTTTNRIGILAARNKQDGRTLRMQSERLTETGDMTADTWYWTDLNSVVKHLGPDKNEPARADGRFIDLTQTVKDTDPPTITPPGPTNVAQAERLTQLATIVPAISVSPPTHSPIPFLEAALPSSPVVTPPADPAAIAEPAPTETRQVPEGSALLREVASVAPSDQYVAVDETTEGYSGGRGVAQLADTGRARATETPQDVFSIKEHVVEATQCDVASVAGNAYFRTGAFGQSLNVGCR